MKTMTALAMAAGLAAASGCDIDPAARSAQSTDEPSRWVEMETQCTVVGDPTQLDPAAMEIYRHEVAALGTMRLTIKKLPMTCADKVMMRSTWSLEGDGQLSLEVRGDRYKHCLCSFDFAPFVLAVPYAARERLDAFALDVRLADTTDPAPLRRTTVGELPKIAD